MCGIAGIISQKDDINVKSLEAMEKIMVHRGPDDNGTFLSNSKKTGLVDRRLGFIGLQRLD